MGKCSKSEAQLLKNKGRIDYYPDIARYHQNEFISFFDHLNTDYLVKRKTNLRKVADRDDALNYISTVKKSFNECLGEMPEKTPVNATVVGTLDKGDYLIDKVLIESLPGYFLSANYYYPKNLKNKAPGILFLCGHSVNGKAADMYVAFCVEAVLNGFCLLTFDPLGQGERKIYDASDSEMFAQFNPDDVHFLVGQQTQLIGDNVTRYMMWDNVRALDYLCSRDEIDTERLAVTGNSGGGHMSAFMGAYDDRLKVIAPCCYITELRSMAYNVGVQESEQSMPDFMLKGLNIADLIIMAAPKPYFIGSSLFDFFPIDGVRDAVMDAQKIYKLLDMYDNIEVYTAPKPHGFWHDTRERDLKFLCKHLDMEFIDDKNIDYENLPQEAELLCTSDGNINSVNKISPQEINLNRAKTIYPCQADITSKDDFNAWKSSLVKSVESVLRIDRGKITADIIKAERSYDSERKINITDISFYSEEHMKVYAVLFEKENASCDKVLVHVGPLDRNSEQVVGYLKEFSALICIETRGTGRGTMEEKSLFNMLPPYGSYVCNADMLGRNIPGMRVQDVISTIKLLKGMNGYSDSIISLYGNSEDAIIALFTAVIENIQDVKLSHLLYSYKSLIENRAHDWGYTVFVYELLKYFDIEDLICCILPGSVQIDGLVDHMKIRLDKAAAEKVYSKCLKVLSLFDGKPVTFIE